MALDAAAPAAAPDFLLPGGRSLSSATIRSIALLSAHRLDSRRPIIMRDTSSRLLPVFVLLPPAGEDEDDGLNDVESGSSGRGRGRPSAAAMACTAFVSDVRNISCTTSEPLRCSRL